MITADDTKTEHKQQLAKLNAEVSELRSLLRQAQRMASVGTMTAMIAHEFNNILTPIINYAQMAKSNPSLTDKAINRAANGGMRAAEICEAILGMTRNAPVELETVLLEELVAETVAAMARNFSKDAIELVIDIPSDLQINTRKVEFQQVLLNLLINARTAVMQKRSIRRVEVHATKENGMVTIVISDTGMGITPGNLKQIFEPFFTTRDGQDGKEQGHGLGLALCREIVESLGGDISAHSQRNQGATFTTRIPA
ncbi:MAG: HAMP domain-containing histidine kinase [bacterium]|nr:HAMP domain-containing histidine kinase [bacterium]